MLLAAQSRPPPPGSDQATRWLQKLFRPDPIKPAQSSCLAPQATSGTWLGPTLGLANALGSLSDQAPASMPTKTTSTAKTSPGLIGAKAGAKASVAGH